MNGFTPGPWTVHSWQVNKMTERVIRGGERHIATMPRATYAEADARLIAAAPDLLAVLKAIAASVECCTLCGCYPHEDNCFVLSAIAKAEGK